MISDDHVAALMGRIAALGDGFNVILSEMNKGDIGPALGAGDIHFGLGPEPWVDANLRFAPIYSEPLLYLSGDAEFGPATLEMLSGKQILQVGDDCGLSAAVRGLFRDHQLKLSEYEGRALGYGALEKWVSLGIGVTLLPASKVADISRARQLNDRSGDAVSIGFCACWTALQEQRPSFRAMRRALVAGAK